MLKQSARAEENQDLPENRVCNLFSLLYDEPSELLTEYSHLAIHIRVIWVKLIMLRTSRHQIGFLRIVLIMGI